MASKKGSAASPKPKPRKKPQPRTRDTGIAEDLRDEILYGRDHDHVRVFVSSRMNGTLDREREAAAAAIDSVSGHRAWWWERDAPIGVLHSEDECIKFAAHSSSLVLLIAGELSDIVYSEYRAGRRGGADRYILIRDDDEIPDEVMAFVQEQRASEVVTRNFSNIDELKSHISRGLTRSLVRALNQQVVARLERFGGSDA